MTIRRWFSSLRLRVRTLFEKQRVERELDELQFHLEQQVEVLMGRGLSAAEARRVAMKAMGGVGGVERQMERCRDVRAWQWLDSLRADVVFGWRQLMKRKVTTAAAVLSLGLAIGACTSVFRLADAIFLRPLPIVAPDRLYVAQQLVVWKGKSEFYSANVSYPNFRQFREAVKGQAELLAISGPSPTDLTYKSDAEIEKAKVQYVSGWMFPSFGLQPTMGRLLSEEDDRAPGASPVAVISYDYWKSRLGGDGGVVGRTFAMDDQIFQIVGVAPKGFTGVGSGLATDVFVPTTMKGIDLLTDSRVVWFTTYALQKEDAAVESVRGRIEATTNVINQANYDAMMDKDYPGAKRRKLNPVQIRLKAAGRGAWGLQSNYGLALMVLGALVAMILLIACANVANLMAAQAAARSREMALRMSIGAGRWRLVRQMMVESALLAVLAAACGVLFSWWATPFVVGRINPTTNPVRLVLSPDWRVVGFGLALTVLVMLLFSLAPALRVSGVKPVSALKGGGDPQVRRRMMQGLIATQVAFCFVVLFLAGLFVTTFRRLSDQPLGFATEHVLLLNTVTHTPQSPLAWAQIAERLKTTPGVESAALAQWPLLSGNMIVHVISVNGVEHDGDNADFLGVGPGWIEAMRIPMPSGRDFRRDETDPHVAIVNRTFAKQFFGGNNPVGRSFDISLGKLSKNYEVVGMVEDAVYTNVHEPVPAMAYVPFQADGAKGGLRPVGYGSFVVRTKDDPLVMAQSLRRAVTEWNTEFRVSTTQTETELAQGQMIRERLLATLAGFFAVVALLLSGIGLYGVLHYSVVQREREIGIRIALGAAAGNIVRLVTVQVFAMVMVGAAVGVALGVGSVRYVQSLLYAVKATDISMMALPAAVLLVAACLAALPAVLRAVRIDPVEMLRAE